MEKVKELLLKNFKKKLFLSASLLINACTPAPPDNVSNVCNIFMQYSKWYWDAKETEKKWHVPVNVQMAIIHLDKLSRHINQAQTDVELVHKSSQRITTRFNKIEQVEFQSPEKMNQNVLLSENSDLADN